jgi:hypothetical protein
MSANQGAGHWLLLILAGGLAAALCLIELLSSLKKPLSRHAWRWVTLRLFFEGGWGAIAYVVLTTTPGLAGISVWIRAILAGFTGSAILRLQLAVNGKGRSRAVGPGAAYQHLCRAVDANIDDIGGVAQSRWITDRVLPALQYLSVVTVVEQTETYLNNLNRISDSKRQAINKFIHDTAEEQSTSDDQKRRVLVQRIIDEGGRRFIQSLIKSTSSTPIASRLAPQASAESTKRS